jgi:hypothetical protein
VYSSELPHGSVENFTWILMILGVARDRVT